MAGHEQAAVRPLHADGIVSQFEGYEDLIELDWDDDRTRHDNVGRLDRILRAEGRDPDAYKVAKHADTVMLFFLFTDEQLQSTFDRLGYPYGPDARRRTVEYYDQRTSHGSTLSHITHAGVLAPIDPESSWERFLIALESDVGDIQGGTTKEGIHTGVMSGTLDLVQRAYLGTEIRDDVLRFDPPPDRSPRRAVAPDAVPPHRGPCGARARRADGRGAGRGRPGHDHGRLSRRRPRAQRRRELQLQGLELSFVGAVFDVPTPDYGRGTVVHTVAGRAIATQYPS